MRYQVTEFFDKGTRVQFFNYKTIAFQEAKIIQLRTKNRVTIYDSKARKNGGDQTWEVKPCGHIEVIGRRK
jgi:hypothetical protein